MDFIQHYLLAIKKPICTFVWEPREAICSLSPLLSIINLAPWIDLLNNSKSWGSILRYIGSASGYNKLIFVLLFMERTANWQPAYKAIILMKWRKVFHLKDSFSRALPGIMSSAVLPELVIWLDNTFSHRGHVWALTSSPLSYLSFHIAHKEYLLNLGNSGVFVAHFLKMHFSFQHKPMRSIDLIVCFKDL